MRCRLPIEMIPMASSLSENKKKWMSSFPATVGAGDEEALANVGRAMVKGMRAFATASSCEVEMCDVSRSDAID